MVKGAGFWKRMKNATKKITEGVAKGAKKYTNFMGSFSGIVNKGLKILKPITNLIPEVGPIASAIRVGTGIADKLYDVGGKIADKAYSWATDGKTLGEEKGIVNSALATADDWLGNYTPAGIVKNIISDNDGSNKVESFDYRTNNFGRSNIGPPEQGQSMQSDVNPYGRSRGFTRPRNYF